MINEPEPEQMVVATHDGTFHADDVFATAILHLALGNVRVLRTRDQDTIDAADIAYDVGGTYDPVASRFDHHMAEPPTRKDGTPYSSAGLLWEHYGYQVLRRNGFETTPTADIQDAWAAIDALFQHIDRVDNGVTPAGPTDIASIIDAMNPIWTDEDVNAEGNAFRRAVDFAEGHLQALIAREAGQLKAELIVVDAAWRSEDPRLVVMDEYAPFRRVVFDRGMREVLYVVSPGGKPDRWTVTAIPVAADSYVNRRDLPAHWAGLSDEALQEVTGVEDAVFAHRNLFIAIAKSKAGAMRLAQIALEEPST